MAYNNYLEGLLSPEQLSDLKYQSVSQGLLGLGQALSRSGAPSLMPQGNGISEGLGAFNQNMQGTMDRALGDILKGAQVKQMIEKQKQDAALKQLYASAITPQYQTTPAIVPQGQTMLDDQGIPTMGTAPEQRSLSGYNYDMKKIVPVLQGMGRFDELKSIAESQKAVRQSGLMGGENAPSPFAPFLNATNPAVRTLAQQLQTGFDRGIIDEETAYKRIEPLAKMEESYIARVDKKSQDAKPTESQYKAATLAGRLEGALTDLKKIGTENEASLKPEVIPSLLQNGLLSYIPGTEMLAGKISSEGRLRAEAAQLDALDAALTLGTGAAYTREQLKGYAKSYFPQVGDGDTVIQEKNDRFSRLVQLARLQAGSAAKNIDEANRLAGGFNKDQFVKDNGLEPRKK
jgi:hypothetical protein